MVSFYELIGELDILQTLAQLKSNHPTICDAEFAPSDAKDFGIEMIRGVHPLIDSPVANNFSLKNSIVITGSNMSGKSTFLRMLATKEDNKTIRFTVVQNVEPQLNATDLYKNFVFEESEEEYDWGLPQGAEIW